MRNRSWIVPAVLLVGLVIVAFLGVSLPALNRAGSYMMVVAAVVLAGLLIIRRR